jgi:hypothetical protein
MEMVMSPEELAASAFTFMGLRTVPVAVTTVHGGRTNGLMALSGGPASVIPEAPRATVGITKYNFSHDLVLNGGVFVMSSVRASPETSAKNPPKRRMIQPGLYISDPPAKNWNASPQGNGYFRLTLAAAQHQAVDVQWWIMVPRGVRATWFEVAPGKIELPIGITPTPGTPYAAQHLDNRGVLQHVQWDLTLDVPISAKFPSMSDIATATYNELALLPNGVMRYLDTSNTDREICLHKRCHAARFHIS